MRPLARKIFLTQGLVILLVFGVSLFAYLSLREARTRASRLRLEYDLGIGQEKLISELRDIARSRAYYFLEKRASGPLTSEFRSSFYHGLDQIGLGIRDLENQAPGREELRDVAEKLGPLLRDFRRAAARLELYLAMGDEERRATAEASFDPLREEMQELMRGAREASQRTVSAEIESLRQAAHRATALALVFCGLAVTAGLPATYWLTRAIHRPVRDLREAAEALSRGEFDRRISVRSRDELGDLARAFNEMAARIQELDELKSGFVSMVSHDLKTPLTSMRDAIDLLAEGAGGEITPRQRRLIAITREGLDRLVSYVQGILDLSRFEAGHVRIVRQPLSFAEIVREQAGQMAARSAEAGVALSIEMEPDLPLVEGDRLWLGQVVGNLLDNALKFTPGGGRVRVRLATADGAPSGRFVVLEVSDTGIGIGPRDLKHVFDKFFQVARSDGGRVEGAGLGLAIVKDLVEAHGGVVSVDSALGRGTTFRVRLQAARDALVRPAAAG